MTKATFFYLSFLFLLITISTNLFAQEPAPNHISGAPAGSYKLDSFASVNLFNGHLNVDLPVIRIGGRGDESHSMTLRMDTQWTIRRDEECNPPNACPEIIFEPYLTGDRLIGVTTGGLSAEFIRFGSDPYGECIGYVNSTMKLVIKTPDGTAHDFVDTVTGGNRNQYFRCSTNAGYRGNIFVSTDGSAATFVTDNIIYDTNYHSGGYTHFVSGYLYLANGTRYRIGGGRTKPN